MATVIDRETLNALADRFDKLAHSDGSLIAGANTINRKTAYSLVSNMGRTDTPRTFKRLAREAMDALGLPSPGGHGAINGWLAHLFDTTPDAIITGGGPVWTGDAEKPDGQLVCWEIRNAAEASAVVIRAAIRQAQPTGDDAMLTPAQSNAPVVSKKTKSSGEARALAMKVEHPDWTDKQIAKAAGVHEKSLPRMKKYRAAKSAMNSAGKAELPRGRRDARTGSLDAFDADDEG